MTFRGSNGDTHYLMHMDAAGDIQYYFGPGYTTNNWTRRYEFSKGGNFTVVTGTISATNFSGTHSGTSSGTNTGDQTNISGSAGSAGSAGYAGYLSTAYAGGQQTNPQVYFNNGVGLKAAMTGAWSVWSDTLWINGYAGSDVLQMCALHTLRNGTPRMAISVQASTATSYGAFYEFITEYNIASQTVSKLNPLSGDSNYKLAYTADGARTNAGEWGRAVMYYVPNGQTYGIRVDRADYSSDSAALGGYGNSNYLGKNGNSYYQQDTWIQINGYHGLYAPSWNGAHWYPNNASSYTTWAIAGSRGSYGGVYDSYSAVHGIMYDSSGNGGVYREANGRWYWYYHLGNACMGIGSSTTSSSYVVYANGAIYATGNICAYSDVRKKENIETIDNALDKVNKMRGVYYNRTDDENKKKQTGVIAQEMEQVLPEVVNYAADVDEYSVAYGNIVGVLIEAIKEQQLQIDELKALLNK
jgi:hypothetical protein